MTAGAKPKLPAGVDSLPVIQVLCDLSAALLSHGRVVLVAPPGAGKTTLVPLHLVSDGIAGRVILIEPRRLAARAAARRMAELLGEAVGETVGWRMRLDTKVSAKTRIEVVTEGVFTRMILDDPELAGVDAVIFDEFHERSLDGDFGLALAIEVATALRDDLKLVVMSATLDGAKVAALLDDAPVVESKGRAFPVTIRHRDRPGTVAVEDAVVAAVRAALAEETGSILVFLPGQKEIRRVAERLQPVLAANVLLAPLYGALDASDQDKAVRPAPAGIRKVVLATDIAETSLTIEGVRIVIDSGLKRRPAFEPETGLTRLETVRVSRASADQRAGRAGRTEPGTAIRLWRAEQTAALDAFDRPEILATDLSGLLLDCAAWGVNDPAQLRLLDPPPQAAVKEAAKLLADLGALDDMQRLTPAGQAMRRLPLPPRLAHMVAAADAEDRRTAAELAVLVTERGLGGTDVDLDSRLRRLRQGRDPRSKQAMALAGRIAATSRSDAQKSSGAGWPSDGDIGAILALGYPDRIALRQPTPGQFALSNGRGGALDPATSLAREKVLVAVEVQGAAAAGRIVSGAALGQLALDRILAAKATTDDTVAFVPQSRSVRASRTTWLGRAAVETVPMALPADARVAAALAEGIRRLGLQRLDFGKEASRLLARLRFLADVSGPPWPHMNDAALALTVEAWLLPYAPGASSFGDLTEGVLIAALTGLVPPAFAGRLDDLAPSHYEAPTGSRVPIRYEGERPVLAIRVQELFGLAVHPAIADGRLPLTLELLSPAHRPIQVTRDLPGFWAGSWRDVRSDLRGRYPKHEWPEDPANAKPTARAKPRR
ncbi:ATP-dependent helicase HrpB [Jiella sp. MQZ9-1]|uniref:ATP-dependent helicase HrpB n=1 Tax=Jiella flava TaxID=2816857 RepID=A0A939FXJ0_9HYPH|nr:ATP-dependent helicase HrpB [Jiella flava]MBO0663345.1 ATP-dependent helicase HrpB [Jiella flava]MCD2471921.1 ATP-dependent helicase HrpB [Jiella flava]